MRLRTAATAATVGLAALALLAGCKKGDANANGANSNSKNTTVTANAASNVAPSPLGTPTSTAAAATPTEAFRLFYDAIKRRDLPAFKSLISRASMRELEETAGKMNRSADDFIKEVFDVVGRDLPPNTPETRNEQINGDRATLETYDPKKGKWETGYFVNEGGWKVAMDKESRGPATGAGDAEDDKGGAEEEDGGGDHGGH